MSVVDEVKDRLDIVEVVGESVDLKKSGKNYTGFCPFHPNTRTPAFVVFPDTETWRCFGACNEGGDLFSFLMKKEGYDFPEALRVLAERAGVEVRPRTQEQEAQEEEREHLRALLEAAVTFYRHQLTKTPEGEAALSYLLGRGLQDEILETFELGFAPAGWETITKYFIEKGYRQQDVIEAGLASERDSGGLYDRFRNRLMIPIRDGRGRMVGFGARALDPEDVPKYLNSPQTELFDKGELLYGLNMARKAIRAEDQAVIVEGYMDVIGLFQAGYKNGVSPMGTALSEGQLRQLKRFSRKIVLALDADAAGDRATLRGLEIAREALDRELDPIFDARGLVRYEGRLDAEIRVITLPQGMDPDELVAADPQAWQDLLSGAQTVVDYVTQVLSADRDLEDAKHKSEIAEQVMPLIQDVADPVEREAYRQKLARHLKLDERTLLSYQRQSRQRSRRGRQAAGSSQPGNERRGTDDNLERFCLGALLERPDLLYQLDREIQTLELERISTGDFTGAQNQEIFRIIRNSLSQHEKEPREHCWEQMGQELNELASELTAALPPLSLDEPKVVSDIVAGFLRLRRRNLATKLSQMQFQLMAAQEQVPEEDGGEQEFDLNQLTREVQRLTVQIRRLDRPPAMRGAAATLSDGNLQ